MPLKQSYAIWNNKGGVGKSTITFHLAARYAERFPTEEVLVIDLCPQSNSSMMLLGGGASGEAEVLKNCTKAIPRTVVGYLSTVIAGGAGAALPNPDDYLITVSKSNPNISPNVRLLCGDGNLEPMSPAINRAADAPALTPTVKPWKWVHLVVRNLIDDIAKATKKPLLVFIDTNPSFAIYTELAISAVNKLITPVNADDSSRVATSAMFILLHGQMPPHPIYGSWTFAAQAAAHGIVVPQIHLVIGNRLTQYLGAAAAFKALSDATADTLFAAYGKHPGYFSSYSPAPKTLSGFRDAYSVLLRDFNTAGVVAAHLGKPLSKMAQQSYNVHGTKVPVKEDRLVECRKAVDAVIDKLV
jgi:cellulose biosynthesis protein BcsQ